MATFQQQPTLKEYNQRLKQEWTRQVACQNQCQPPESCSCLRQIIHVEALGAWWKRKLSEVNGTTNLHRLLQEMQIGPHRNFPLEYETFFTGEYQCLKVFSLLLSKDLGYLIDRFYQAQMNDNVLHHDGNYGRLRDNLSDTIESSDAVENIIQQFRREKWSFCPLELQLYMDRPLEDTKVIAPFCHKIKLNEGGTASVYLVAVQKDLIRDERLKAVLQDSLYHDTAFGECYKLAMKTYVGNKKSAFDAEKDAFSALKSNTDVPIVRYLGSFTHDYGEGIAHEDYHLRKTYNLLLEYGELDLYQYWADETNVPPVRVNEIICYWEKLFEIAVAIRNVHHLDVSQWKSAPLKYYGWHADIKPDNILLVNGRFKLADFGASAFDPVAKTKSGTVPTKYIHGFTDTYGAPEVSRMMRPKGTTSEVTQSIDTWSFGCVLSVAATWVVLGFQGVRQYETLRRLSPANKNTNDRFHNGIDALPEVKKWHNYLRGHLRQSDTATSMVLDLIEHNMLQTETNNRLGMKALCKRLDKLIKDAKEEAANLETHTKITDNVVLEALLTLEKEAQALSSKPKTTPLRRRSKEGDGSDKQNSSEQDSALLPKDAAIRSTPLGQTTFRKEILENELQGKSFVDTHGGHPRVSGHGGDFTESPIDAHPEELPQPGHDMSPRLQPISENQHQRRGKDKRLEPPSNVEQRHLSWSPNGTHPVGSVQPLAHDYNYASSNTSRTSPRHLALPSHDPRSGASPPSQTDILYRTAPESPLAHQPVRRLGNGVAQWSPDGFENLPFINTANITTTARTGDLTSQTGFESPRLGAERYMRDSANFGQPSRTSFTQQAQSHTYTVPLIKTPTPRSSYSHPAPDQSNPDPYSSFSPLSPVSPSITVTSSSGQSASNIPESARFSGSQNTDKQVVAPEEHGRIDSEELPPTVYDLPYNICRVRKEIDSEKPKGMRSQLMGMIKGEERKPNTTLKKTYGNDREIVLIVDNGWTMCRHWPIVTFVAETLAKNAAGLDKDGIDLMFTVSGKTLNIPKIKGDNGRQALKDAMRRSWPEDTKSNDTSADMGQVLDDVYKNWKSKGTKPMTLLVLTDGDWSKTDHAALNQIILDFAKSDTQRAGPRHFSIQLIRFGEEHKAKLTWLDDQLCQQNGCKDIIDHCSWRTTVDKMFRGSIETWHDTQDPDEPDITYNYRHLVAFFESFNDDGMPPLLSPKRFSQSRKSLSRTSSKSSIQKKHESAPPERMDSRSGTHRRIHSEHYVDKEYE